MTNTERIGSVGAGSSRPLLSIIIPTHNRQKYAVSAIRCALSIPSSDLEVVVQDCSDNDQLASMLAPDRQDKRLSYSYEPHAYMTENWNRAIARATGEYLCVIGDDDGVNPEIIQAAAWAESRSLDCLATQNNADYRWPGTGARPPFLSASLKRPLPGSLVIYPFRGYLTIVTDMEAELRKFLRDGGAYFMHFNLPKLYYGLVHRRCLDSVRERIGTYCRSVSPDMFLSLAIACTAPRMMVTDYPLTIQGVCPSSNSNVVSILNKQSLRLQDQPEIYDTGYKWSDKVPPVYTVPAVWADAAVSALIAMGRDDLLKQLNLPRLAAHCVRANRGVAQTTLQSMFRGLRTFHKNRGMGAIKFAWNVLDLTAALQIDRIRRLLLTITGKGRQRIDRLSTMVDTSRALTSYLIDNGWSFKSQTRIAPLKDPPMRQEEDYSR